MAVNKVIYGSETLIDLSDSTVSASDMAEGVIAYEANGEKVTGNVHVESANNTFKDGEAVYSSITSQIGVKRTYSEDTLIRSGVTIFHHIDASNFGDANPRDVASGKTFTSVNGIKITGTAEASTSDNNCEAYLIDVTNPVVNFKGTGTIKIYGYAQGATSGYTTPKYGFTGDAYTSISSWGSGSSKVLNISVDSTGKISGLPSMTSGTLLAVVGV